METVFDLLKKKYPTKPWSVVWNYKIWSPLSVDDAANVRVQVWFSECEPPEEFNLSLS